MRPHPTTRYGEVTADVMTTCLFLLGTWWDAAVAEAEPERTGDQARGPSPPRPLGTKGKETDTLRERPRRDAWSDPVQLWEPLVALGPTGNPELTLPAAGRLGAERGERAGAEGRRRPRAARGATRS